MTSKLFKVGFLLSGGALLSQPREVAQFEVLREPVTLPGGAIMAIGIRLRDGIQEVNSRDSADDGLSWSEPHLLFTLPRKAGGFGFYRVFIDRHGELHIFLLCDANTGLALPRSREFPGSSNDVLDIWQVKSRGGRTAWDQARRIWQGRAGDLLCAVQLASGRILLPISYLTQRGWSRRLPGFGAFTDFGTYDSSVLYSDDEGETWRQSRSVLRVPTPDIGAIGGVEPAVIQLRDGRVWMLIRTQMGRFYESFSVDGSEWSEPRPSSVVASESPAGLARLADGRLLMLVNDAERFPYAFGGRHVLHGAISEDEGRTWHGYREVARDPLRNEPPPPNGDFGVAYPFIALTRHGDVILSLGIASGTRSQWPEGLDGPPHDERRSMIRFDPAWLDARTQRTDFSRGLDDWSVFGTRGVSVVPCCHGVGAPVLRISHPDATWPSGAVWNFPAAQNGKLHLRVLREAGAPEILAGLTDHFSVPWDEEDRPHNLFNFSIGSGALQDHRWHDIEFIWDCARRECRVLIDGRPRTALTQQRLPQSQGACYLRLRCSGPAIGNAGILIQSADVQVSAKRR